jgi:hypothetical protein
VFNAQVSAIFIRRSPDGGATLEQLPFPKIPVNGLLYAEAHLAAAGWAR